MDTALAGLKYLGIVILIVIVILVIIDNLKQKTKPDTLPKTLPKNSDNLSKPLDKKSPSPLPYIEPSSPIRSNTSPLEV